MNLAAGLRRWLPTTWRLGRRERLSSFAHDGIIVELDHMDTGATHFVVDIDLGYGRECWVVDGAEASIDRRDMRVRNAKLIARRGEPAGRREVESRLGGKLQRLHVRFH